MQRDSMGNIIKVALLLCLVCSVLVSAAAVGLRERQNLNRKLSMQRKVLEVAGLCDPDDDDVDVAGLFRTNVDARVIDLVLGRVDDDLTETADEFDQWKLAKSTSIDDSTVIPAAVDIAGVKRRENFSIAYLVPKKGQPEQLILPIRGYGLWSTLYGFISLDIRDIDQGPEQIEIAGITYYKHGETPGLGGEVDNPNWKAKWPGKIAFDGDWNVLIEVSKNANSDHAVDAIAGATITSRGVTNMLQYWLGNEGFGPYLNHFAAQAASNSASETAAAR